MLSNRKLIIRNVVTSESSTCDGKSLFELLEFLLEGLLEVGHYLDTLAL